MALNPNDMASFMSAIGVSLPSDLNVQDFKDFGKMTSNIYRARLFMIFDRLMTAGKLNRASIPTIIYFASLIKNKDRIIKGMANMQSKYGTAQWFKDTLYFYQTETVQYVSEAEKKDKFPVVNIPTCMPDITAHFFKVHLKGVGIAYTDAELLKAFKENLWFCQLNISQALSDEHRLWETDFWNNTVTKTKNSDSARYNREKGFQAAYYNTKAADNYRFLVNGTSVDQVFDEPALLAWLKA